jgi:serine O-acetyltransferase
MSQLAFLRADLRRLYEDFDAHPGGRPPRPLLAALLNPGFQSVALYRLSRALHLRGRDTAAWVVTMLNTWVTGADFLPSASIGPGFVLTHPVGCGSWGTVGRNLRMNGMCQLGTTPDGAPTVGDDVFLGAGSMVVGPVHIGDGAVIGAMALVTTDVPAGHRAVGVPARILPPKELRDAA